MKSVISRKILILKTFLSILALTLLLGSCTQNNVTEDDSLKQYFDIAGVAGTFGMFDNGQGHFTIYNLKRFRDSAYLPAATFDIVAMSSSSVSKPEAGICFSSFVLTDVRRA